MHNSSSFPIISTNRIGLQDMWNAFMVRGATFSVNDIPLCPTTASGPPHDLISYDDAKTVHNKEIRKGNFDYHIDAFIHYFIDDQRFDGKRNSIWLYPEKALDIIRHFSGIISPDFSTYIDFPEPLKLWNIYRMNAFGYWISTLGIPVISNVRWGTEETWDYCFDGNPHNSMLAVGTVASGIRYHKNRPVFENGLLHMVRILHPHTIVFYGSVNNTCIETLRQQGIHIVSFQSKTNMAFSRRKQL